MSGHMELGVSCGKCGAGPVYMLTCNHFRATGHTWVIVSVCLLCRNIYWIESGCPDCQPRPAVSPEAPHGGTP